MNRLPERRIAVATAGSLAIMAVGAVALQLRPFHFSTINVEESLVDFHRNRELRMVGGLIRAAYLLAAIPFSAALIRVFRQHSGRLLAAGGMVAGAILWAVAGVVTVVLGVPAEEYARGNGDATLLVVADVMFWVQDNLVTYGTLAMAIGVAAFAWPYRRDQTVVGRAVATGLVMLPASGIASLAWFFRGETRDDPAWYFAAVAIAAAAFVVWLIGVAAAASGVEV